MMGTRFGRLRPLLVAMALTLAGFASKLGLASGTAAAGLMLRRGEYPALIGASFAALALCAVAALLAAHRSEPAAAAGRGAAG